MPARLAARHLLSGFPHGRLRVVLVLPRADDLLVVPVVHPPLRRVDLTWKDGLLLRTVRVRRLLLIRGRLGRIDRAAARRGLDALWIDRRFRQRLIAAIDRGRWFRLIAERGFIILLHNRGF